MTVNKALLATELLPAHDPAVLALQKTLREKIEFQQERFSQAQAEISKPQEISDLKRFYTTRDDAFFKYLDQIRQLRSAVTVLTDFKTASAIPIDAKTQLPISSKLDKYDSEHEAHLAEVEAYILDKEQYDRDVQQLKTAVSNPLMARIKNLTKQINQLTEAFHAKWPENKREGYNALLEPLIDPTTRKETESMVDTLRRNKSRHDALEAAHERMELAISQYGNRDLISTYEQLKQEPSKATLFKLCEQILINEFHDMGKEKERNLECEQIVINQFHDMGKEKERNLEIVLPTLKQLYPELASDIDTLRQKKLLNLTNGEILRLLEHINSTIYQNNIVKLGKKINSAVARIKLLRDKDTEEAQRETAELRTYYKDSKPLFDVKKKFHDETMTPCLQAFTAARTGENFRQLYLLCSDPAHPEYKSLAESLRTLYPAALAQLEAEQDASIILRINHEKQYHILEKHLQKVTQLAATDRRFQDLSTCLINFTNPKWGSLPPLHAALTDSNYFADAPLLAAFYEELQLFCIEGTALPRSAKPETVKPKQDAIPETKITDHHFFQPSPVAQAQVSTLPPLQRELKNQLDAEIEDHERYWVPSKQSDVTPADNSLKWATIRNTQKILHQYLNDLSLSTEQLIKSQRSKILQIDDQAVDQAKLSALYLEKKDYEELLEDIPTQSNPEGILEELQKEEEDLLQEITRLQLGPEKATTLFSALQPSKEKELQKKENKLRDVQNKIQCMPYTPLHRDEPNLIKKIRHCDEQIRELLHPIVSPERFKQHKAVITDIQQKYNTEREFIETIQAAISTIQDILYARETYDPDTLQTCFETIDTTLEQFDDHPIKQAVKHIIEQIKLTNEYADVTQPRSLRK